jgi:hypothetical protein
VLAAKGVGTGRGALCRAAAAQAGPACGDAPDAALAAQLPADGEWNSDHAVVDRATNTLHGVTGVESAAIPPGLQTPVARGRRRGPTEINDGVRTDFLAANRRPGAGGVIVAAG